MGLLHGPIFNSMATFEPILLLLSVPLFYTCTHSCGKRKLGKISVARVIYGIQPLKESSKFDPWEEFLMQSKVITSSVCVLVLFVYDLDVTKFYWANFPPAMSLPTRIFLAEDNLLHAQEHISETSFHFSQYHDNKTSSEEGFFESQKAIVKHDEKSRPYIERFPS